MTEPEKSLTSAPPDQLPGWEKLRRVVARWAVAGTVLAALGSLAACLGGWVRLCDYATHFRPHLLALVAVCLPALFLLKRYRKFCLAVAALVLLSNALEVAPWYVTPDVDPAVAGRLRVQIANVYTANRRFDEFMLQVRKTSPDLLAVLEVNAEWMAKLEALKDILPYVIAAPRNDNFGIAIFSRHPFLNRHRKYFGAAGVPALVVTIQPGPQACTVIAAHTLPPVSPEYFQQRNRQLAELGAYIREHEGPLVLLADLNTTMWSSHYKRFVAQAGLVNARQGFGLLPTWPATLPAGFRLPLDHILHDSRLVTLNCERGLPAGSDHFPLLAEIGFRNEEP